MTSVRNTKILSADDADLRRCNLICVYLRHLRTSVFATLRELIRLAAVRPNRCTCRGVHPLNLVSFRNRQLVVQFEAIVSISVFWTEVS